jgi:hypothetical protein
MDIWAGAPVMQAVIAPLRQLHHLLNPFPRLDPIEHVEPSHSASQRVRLLLPREGEGWLSEETHDDHSRLDKHRVWVVDPLDGTREFVLGLPPISRVSVPRLEDRVPDSAFGTAITPLGTATQRQSPRTTLLGTAISALDTET